MARYDHHQHASLTVTHGEKPGVGGRAWLAWALWLLGYPDQARQHLQAAMSLAEELAYPVTQASTAFFAASLYMIRRESPLADEQAEAASALSRQWRLPVFLALSLIIQGWPCVAQGRAEEGVSRIPARLVVAGDAKGVLANDLQRVITANGLDGAGADIPVVALV